MVQVINELNLKHHPKTLIIQFYISTNEINYERKKCNPFLSIVDLILNQQSSIIKILGQYLDKIKNSNKLYQEYTKTKIINESLYRNILTPNIINVFCQIEREHLMKGLSDLLLFFGSLHRTTILTKELSIALNLTNPKNEGNPITNLEKFFHTQNTESNKFVYNDKILPTIPERRRARSHIKNIMNGKNYLKNKSFEKISRMNLIDVKPNRSICINPYLSNRTMIPNSQKINHKHIIGKFTFLPSSNTKEVKRKFRHSRLYDKIHSKTIYKIVFLMKYLY